MARGASRHDSHISIGFAIIHSNEDLVERAYTRVYGRAGAVPSDLDGASLTTPTSHGSANARVRPNTSGASILDKVTQGDSG